MNVDKELDCKGLYCPLPVVKTKLALEQMESGEILLVISDDPAAKKDFFSWCQETGEKLLEIRENGGVFKIYIQKK